MDLSVVIVSYNVRAFLEQCLVSVERASSGLDLEVWVVDNNSVDGSVEMVRSRFPEVHLVANRDNVGFSVANNQAIRQSKGEHVLLLNPDTVVREDTFVKGLAHMKAHPEVGGIGVPMYDGTGQFLPESKRGVPTPWAAFCRMAGLHHLAPRSPKWNAYYAGHVAEDETAEIDILSGAFMWMRKKALDDVGLLDEQFFMYGEDIDLSWRLVQGGWRNHYLASTSIIHYKGESTKKGSLNYVLVFYRAMLLFAAKHFEGRQAKLFSWMIRLAIYGRAGLAIVRRLFSRWGELIQVAALSTVLLAGWLVLLDTDGSRQLTWQDVGWQAPVLLGVQWLGMWALGWLPRNAEQTVVVRSAGFLDGGIFVDLGCLWHVARGLALQQGRGARFGRRAWLGPWVHHVPVLEARWQPFSRPSCPRGRRRLGKDGGPFASKRGGADAAPQRGALVPGSKAF